MYTKQEAPPGIEPHRYRRSASPLFGGPSRGNSQSSLWGRCFLQSQGPSQFFLRGPQPSAPSPWAPPPNGVTGRSSRASPGRVNVPPSRLIDAGARCSWPTSLGLKHQTGAAAVISGCPLITAAAVSSSPPPQSRRAPRASCKWGPR